MEQDIRNRLQVADVVTKKDSQELLEFETYGSMGMISTLIDILVMLNARIERGDVIKDENNNNEVFTAKSFKKYVERFSPYVVKEMYKETNLHGDVFFKLQNTDDGLDLIYNADKPNKMFKWIANIDNDYALVYLRFNHVVYIQNRRTHDVTLMYSEHNNCYTYDESCGKIKEVFS